MCAPWRIDFQPKDTWTVISFECAVSDVIHIRMDENTYWRQTLVALAFWILFCLSMQITLHDFCPHTRAADTHKHNMKWVHYVARELCEICWIKLVGIFSAKHFLFVRGLCCELLHWISFAQLFIERINCSASAWTAISVVIYSADLISCSIH